MKNTLTHLLFVAAFTAAVPVVSAQTLLMEYKFNETGSAAANSGSLSGADMTLYNAAGITSGSRVGTAADLHSASGSGVGGQGRAFDNTASTAMGGASAIPAGSVTGNRAQTPDGVSASVGALQSFTIQGWFKTSGTAMVGDGAKLLESYTTVGPAGFTLSAFQNGRLTLNVDGNSLASGTAGSTLYGATESWVFFAATYNGTSTTNNVNFYVGSETTAASLISTGNLDSGSLGVSGTGLALGNGLGTNSRPFDGLLDDIRFYGSTTGADGVLNLSQLETLRLGAIPEPSTVTMLGGFGLTVMMKLAGRRRRLV
jgi:Concanavalin A-like lectin/glucanases superfamily